ncbi:MAG: peptidylprolyl isomerase [Caulobacterales bacterium]
MKIKSMLSACALLLALGGNAWAKGPQDDPETYRPLDAENSIQIDTGRGLIVVEMYPEVAPLAVARVKELARKHFYDGLKFHRVIDGFMAQGGDPKGDGTGGSELPDLPGEFTMRRDASFELKEAASPAGSVIGFHKMLPMQSQPTAILKITADKKAAAWPLFCQGVMAMARAEGPDSANSQFFLMRGPYPSLEKRYTALGRVVEGQEVVDMLPVGEPPANPGVMKTIRVVADLPEASRPKLYVIRTNSDGFKDRIKDARKDEKANFSACDVAPKARVAE